MKSAKRRSKDPDPHAKRGARVSSIALTSITIDPYVQVRAAMSDPVLEEYADAMRAGVKFPPLTIFSDGKINWVADGFHRLNAAKRAGRAKIQCDVRAGALRDAVLFAAGANDTHGLRRSNDDKRLAVQRLLDDEQWREWSNRVIARHCRVSHQLVGELRKVTGPATSERTFTTKHGTEATMDVRNIGQRRRGAPSGAKF